MPVDILDMKMACVPTFIGSRVLEVTILFWTLAVVSVQHVLGLSHRLGVVVDACVTNLK